MRGAMLLPQPPWPSRRFLQSGSDSGFAIPSRVPGIPPADPPSGGSSDVVVILAALLCALICVIGLAAVARCARSSRNRAAAAEGGGPSSPTSSAADAGLFGGGHHGAGAAGVSVTATTSNGLKKRALKALPKLAYADAVAAAAAARGAPAVDADGEEGRAEEVLAECAICLSEFGEREEVRVMPQCGHGFHVACVDTWLRSNSSCPSCRRPIVIDDPSPPKRCRKCEAVVLEAVVASSSSSTAGGSGRSRGGGFLP